MRIRVEVADTPYKQATGLMHRERLSDDAGMLFVFSNSRVLSFWGENTLIPLDIAFINSKGKIEKLGRIDKLSRKNVSSEKPCTMAIEVNAGLFDQYGISEGDHIEIAEDYFEGTVVKFRKAGKSEGEEEQTLKEAQLSPFDQGLNNQGLEDDNWLQEARDFQVQESGWDDSSLPEVSLDDILFADDDYGEQEAAEEQSEQATEEGTEPVPDVSGMNSYQAAEYAMDNGYVMWINYTTLPKKRKIGPISMPKRITRIIQPHGIFNAKTTGNTILVTWDMSMNDYRAFVIDRIDSQGLTGQKFSKWFAVRH